MKKRHGFTLLELLITIAIVAIVATLAIPGFAEFVRNQRATTSANDLLISLTFARSEAIKRGQPVSVCASDDGASCAGDNDWDDGWIVFMDVDGPGPDGVVNPDGSGEDDAILRVHQAINAIQLAADGGNTFVAFGPEGLAVNASDFTLVPDGCTANQQRSIRLSPTGRADVVGGACP